MRIATILSGLGLVAALSLGPSGANAGERGFHFHDGHHHGGGYIGRGGLGYGYAGPYGYGGYGFADAAVNGDYIGAPYTRFPRPRELVPPAWGYGTYGVPTTTGIRQAPSADPTVYVIDSPTRARRQVLRARVISQAPDGGWVEPTSARGTSAGGARVVTVSTDGR